MFESIEEVDQIETEPKCEEAKQAPKMPNGALQNDTSSPDSGHPSSRNFSVTSGLSDGSLSTEDSAGPEVVTSRSAAVTQSLNKPPVIKTGSAAEDSPEEREVKEEEAAAPVVTNAVENTTAEGEGASQPSEGVEEKYKINETPEGFGATQARQTDEFQTCKPEVLSLAGEKDEQPADHMARESSFASQRDEAQDATESDESPSAIEMEEIPKAKVSMVPWSRKGFCEATSLSNMEQGKPSAEATQSVPSEGPDTEGNYTNSVSRHGSTKGEAPSTGFSVGTLI